MTDQLTPRARAAGILSGAKLRMLEDAGLTVVAKARLEALERLYEAERRRNKVLYEKPPYGDDFDYDYATDEERAKADKWAVDNSVAYEAADDEVDAALAELEAMTDGQTTVSDATE